MARYTFTVDAALLRELGERLVGRPHIALAELIKNSYDADATAVEVSFDGSNLTVTDNGHGMSEEHFRDRWMRIGTTTKARAGRSPRLRRPLTGSKGVGRLSVQVLGAQTRVVSRGLLDQKDPEAGLSTAVSAAIDWESAVQEGDLTAVAIDVIEPEEPPRFAGDSESGTIVMVGELHDEWQSESFKKLAQEIWALRPPFEESDGAGMSITLRTHDVDTNETFAAQMGAILDIWSARIVGRLVPREPGVEVEGVLPPSLTAELPTEDSYLKQTAGRPDRVLRLDVQIRGGARRRVHYLVPASAIDRVRFDIRVFSLHNRQPLNVSVGEARDYLRQYGGVNLFDTGFRLPYYGVEQDWLDSERDHARRLDRSKLVPASLQVQKGLQDLPPNVRLYGVVQVSTNHEAEVARRLGGSAEPLTIQISRDRLTDNWAYQQLRVVVRSGLDLYAMETARAKFREVTAVLEATGTGSTSILRSLKTFVEEAESRIEPEVFQTLRSSVGHAYQAARASDQKSAAYASLLGALATAGSTSLAYEHEISKQVAALGDLSKDLERLASQVGPEQRQMVDEAIAKMSDWQGRMAGIRAVFGPLLVKESRDTVARYRARTTVEKVARDIKPLAPGIAVDTSNIPRELMLPPATLPAWTSVFQNLLLNSYNALERVERPVIRVVGNRSGVNDRLTFIDNGAGVDLASAEDLWQPFERRLLLSPEREAAGLGGMGLGLTIVRMITDDVGVRAKFVAPPAGFSTAVELLWREEE